MALVVLSSAHPGIRVQDVPRSATLDVASIPAAERVAASMPDVMPTPMLAPAKRALLEIRTCFACHPLVPHFAHQDVDSIVIVNMVHLTSVSVILDLEAILM